MDIVEHIDLRRNVVARCCFLLLECYTVIAAVGHDSDLHERTPLESVVRQLSREGAACLVAQTTHFQTTDHPITHRDAF